MLKLAGYADRLSVRPGETIAFKLSNLTGAPVSARIVRVICADANPAGPGIREEELDIDLPELTVGAHPVPRGACATADLGTALDGLADFTLVLSLQPTLLPDTRSAVLSITGDAPDARGLTLSLDNAGRLEATVGEVTVTSSPLPAKRWADVAVSFDKARGRLRLAWKPVARRSTWQSAEAELTAPPAPGAAPVLTLAGPAGASTLKHFDGRLENPHLYARVLSDSEVDATRTPDDPPRDPLFAFDFARETTTSRIIDTGPAGLVGQLVNHPARAMRASRWSGHEMCWRHAPAEYAAIHFHGDDMTDCRWPTALEWTVPADFRSASYALRIEAGGEADNIPFFVVPPKGKQTARIAVLVSTFTYTIYANHARGEFLLSKRWAESWRRQAADWQAYPENPGDHPEYAWSTYNNHTDGSGVSVSSWSRPMLNVRIGYITYPGPDIRASGLRHYPADSHLHTWLEDQGYDFDIITDFELHHEGAGLLKPYQVVMTGSHPEYHTREMLDALETYRDGGGRFMYLGGNGFYWKIALDPERDGVIEIRRAEGGIRAWAAEPGEYYNQFDGEYGGLWRRNGRPPQDLCGVGFSAQGNFVGSHYHVDPSARNSRAAWILEGVDGATFGGHGLSGHGAAGFELDRADKNLGTPPHAVVLATSEGHEPEAPWVLVPEERLTHLTTMTGESEEELIHSDIVFFETPNNGAVFSVGSITYCGSLLTNGGDNDISRLTRNVIDRFLDPAATFDMP